MNFSTAAVDLLIGIGLTSAKITLLENYEPLILDLNAFALSDSPLITSAETTRYEKLTNQIQINVQGNVDDAEILSIVHELKHAVGERRAGGITSYTSPELYANAELRNEAEAQLAEYRAYKSPELGIAANSAYGKTTAYRSGSFTKSDFNYYDEIEQIISSNPGASDDQLIALIADNVCRDIVYPGTENSLTYDEMYRWSYLVQNNWVNQQDIQALFRDPGFQLTVEGEVVLPIGLYAISAIKSLVNNTFSHMGSNTTFTCEVIDAGAPTAAQDYWGEVLGGFEGTDYLFGTDGKDNLLGGGGRDFLSGGVGTDLLIGGYGADVLNGGDGFDTYRCTLNDPTCIGEVINDADSTGELYIDGERILGGTHVRDRTWLDSSGKYYLVESTSSDGNAWLTIMSIDGILPENTPTINIQNWRHGETKLGITLEGGNRDPLSIEVSDPGTSEADYRSGDDVAPTGNAAARSIASIMAAVPQPLLGAHLVGNDGADNLRGKTGEFSDILEGGAGNDLINGAGGKDELFGDGGDDMITGFGDESVVHGGTGNDYISAIRDSGWRLTSLMPTIVSAQSIWNDAASFFNWHVEQNAVPVEGEMNFEVTWLTLSAGFSVSGVSSIEGAQFWFWDNNDGTTYSLKYQLADWDDAAFVVNYGSVLSRSVRTLSEFEIGVSLYGDGGNDFLVGSEGSDTLDGGEDDDSISGREGNDSLNGGSGADTIYGGSGNDFVDGDEGIDKIYGGKGNDFLSGGQGDDEIYGDDNGEPAGNDHLNGNEGNDLLMGAAGNDVLEGGDGDDELSGDSAQTEDSLCGDDILVGGAGNDKLFGNGGNDVLEGGEGTDFLNGGRGNDALSGGSGLNYYQFSAGFGQDSVRLQIGADEVIQFFDGSTVGDLVFEKSDMGLLITTRSGDTVQVVNYFAPGMSVSIWCQSDGSILTPDDFSTNDLFKPLIAGSAANDTLVGTGVDERLSGLGGSDTLDAGAGDDVLIGGAGDDLLRGGAGTNAYRFSSGWGNDTIDVTEGASEIIVFDSTVEKSSIEFSLDTTANLRIRNGQIGDEIVLLSFDERITSNVIVQFSDGTSLNRQDIYSAIAPTVVDVTLDGTPEKDVLVGNALDNIISGDFGNDLILGGDGDDFINAGPVQNEDPGLGRSDADTVYGQSGNDTIYGLEDSDYLDGGIGDDQLYGGIGADILVGGAGNDLLVAGQWVNLNTVPGSGPFEEGANDLLIGGAGNDELHGGGGNNMYVFAPGFGHDTLCLFEGQAIPGGGGNVIGTYSGEVATVKFEIGISASDLSFVSEGDNLRLVIGADSLLIEGFYSLSLPAVSFVFVDGSNLTAQQLPVGVNVQLTEGNDTYSGTIFSDRIEGGSGDDNLSGGEGSDFVHGGFGQDTLHGDAGDDRLWGDTGRDTVYGDGGSDIFYANAENVGDLYFGGSGDDTYIFRQGYYFEQSEGVDSETKENLNEGRDVLITDYHHATLAPNIEDLKIEFNARNLRYSAGEVWSATYIGNDLNNTIQVLNPESAEHAGRWYELNGMGGTDVLIGGRGNDTYVLDRPEDVVIESAEFSSIDTIKTCFSYSIADQLGIENILLYQYNSLEMTVSGNDRDNILDSTAVLGQMILQGGNGNDTYRISRDNNSELQPVHNFVIEGEGQGYDIVEFSVWNYFYASPNTTYYSAGYLNVEEYRLDQKLPGGNIVGSEKNEILRGNSRGNLLDGGDGDDAIYSGGSSSGSQDTLIGGAGDDNLYSELAGAASITGGLGNDTLHLGDGSELIFFSQGDGNDVIDGIGVGSSDTITFTSAIDPKNVFWARSGANLLITFSDSPQDSITVEGYWTSDAPGASLSGLVDTFLFANGEVRSGDFPLLGNHAPIAISEELELSIGRGGATTVLLAQSLFSDIDGDALVYSLGLGAPSWLQLDPETGVLQVNVPNDLEIDQVEAVVLATDPYGATVSSNLALKIFNSIMGTAGNDALIGTSHVDILQAFEGDDVLDGNGGGDQLLGGLGNDTYVVRDSRDEVIEQIGSGVDIVQLYEDAALIPNIETIVLVEGGNARVAMSGEGSQTLVGNASDNELDGGLGMDVMQGKAGDDRYYVDDLGDQVIEVAGEGTDSIYTSVETLLPVNVEELYLMQAGKGVGNALDNYLEGSKGDDILDGGSGNDELYGDLGNDTLIGGEGNDTYWWTSGFDTLDNTGGGTDKLIFENVSSLAELTFHQEGNDLLILVEGDTGQGVRVINHFLGGAEALDSAGIDGGPSYTASYMNAKAWGYDNVVQGTANNETLNGTSGNDLILGAAGNDVVNGAAGDDRLLGEAGADTLNGGTGTDRLEGGLGDDTYTIGDTLDLVIESANEGNDLVKASVTYALPDNVENLTLTGASAINGVGNTLDNTLVGNSATNVLTGGAGDDTLDGGAGNDTLIGGTGNDIFVVNTTGDVVAEAANEGIDLVKSSATYSLGNDVENLILTGTTAINGTGNTLDNVLTGNSGNNALVGNAGHDTLEGGAGTDTLTGGIGNDIYRMGRGFGADTVIENDATAGNFDIASILSGVAYDQLWFQKPTSTNDLKVSIIGTNDALTIKSWYSGAQYQVEQIQTADGYTLTAAKVQTLVGKMATMTKPTGTTLTSSQRSQLASTFASTWTSGSQFAGRSMKMSAVDSEVLDKLASDSTHHLATDDVFSNDRWFDYGKYTFGHNRTGHTDSVSPPAGQSMATSQELQRLIEAMAQSNPASGVHVESLDVNAGISDLLSRKSFGVAPAVRLGEWA